MTENQTREIVTVELSREQIRQEISLSCDTLASLQLVSVLVEYGWGTNVDSSGLWQPYQVVLVDLSKFVSAAEEAGIYRAGAADLIVRDAENKFGLLFCHESDIHLTTTSGALANRIVRDWLSRGITAKERSESGEWVTLQVAENA